MNKKMIVQIYGVVINLFNLNSIILFKQNSLRHLMSGGLTVNIIAHRKVSL